MKRAIGYVVTPTPGSRLEVACDEQQERIRRYCESEGLELLEIVEESGVQAHFLDRPQLRRLLQKVKDIDYIIVERPSCLSRNSSRLGELLERLDESNVRLACATLLWDCVSQSVRRHYGPVRHSIPRPG